MTMPFLNQSAVAGLLRHAKRIAEIPDDDPMQGGGMLQPTPPFNPNAPPPTPQRRPGLLSRLNDLGQPTLDENQASQLTPEEIERVTSGGGLLGRVATQALGMGLLTPKMVAEAKAKRLIAGKDEMKTRKKMEREERLFGQIQEQAASIQDPQARLEYVARMSAGMGLPQGQEAATAADRLRQPQMQSRANAKLTVLGGDGNYYAIQQDATGAEVPGSRVRVPKPTSGITYREGVGPDGTPVIYALPSEESGDVRGPVKPRETGVEVPVPDKGDPMTIKVINNERTLAYDDAQLSIGAIGDGKGGIKNPPGNWDRAMTKSEWTNALATEDGQHYLNNVKKLIRSWVVLIEGKRMSDADARVNELQRSFAVGDKSVVVEGKKQTLLSMAKSIKELKRTGGIVQPVPGETPTETREAMWNRLTAGGMGPEQATAAVLKAKP